MISDTQAAAAFDSYMQTENARYDIDWTEENVAVIVSKLPKYANNPEELTPEVVGRVVDKYFEKAAPMRQESNMSQQQTQEDRLKILRAVLSPSSPMWPKDIEPAVDDNGETHCFENLRVIHEEIAGKPITVESLYRSVMTLRKEGKLIPRTKTVTVVQVAPPPVDPGTTLPHEDIPELKTIRNLTDVIRVKNLPKEKLMRFANLKTGSPSFKEFNERMQYILEHRIGDGDAPNFVEKENATSTKSASSARALVDALRPGDIGSTNSSTGGGRWTQLGAAQSKLQRYIDSLVQQRTNETKIAELVASEIKKLSDSGIR